jgi:dynein light chain Tctex-type 1
MDAELQENESRFVAEDVSQQISEALESMFAGCSYQSSKIDPWTDQIVETSLGKLAALEKNFKYIVNAVIMQKTGAGLHAASSCYWDNNTDGSCTITWSNQTMHVVITVFGLAI